METIVVGAGQAGIATSHELAARGVDHVVLEAGRIGQTWRTRRWDSFRLVTPNWMNVLPGQPPTGPDDAYSTAAAFVAGLTAHAARHGLPIVHDATVEAAHRIENGFAVRTTDASYTARSLVVASGFQWQPRVPAVGLPSGIAGVHSSAYRNPATLPGGAVVVVGSGQTGSQLALELAGAGRAVFLCTSRVRRLPRRYRGRDMMAWWHVMGLYRQGRADLPDPSVADLAQPVVAGTEGGRSISLHQLARAGVILLGRLLTVDGWTLRLGDDRDENVSYADRSADEFRREVDAFVGDTGCEREMADEPAPLREAPRELDLRHEGVGSVLWCTGHSPAVDWLDVPLSTPDIHVVGRPWLTCRASGILHGMPTDAAQVAAAIAR
jgi:putative flavoprotein involved in K+ transport